MRGTTVAPIVLAAALVAAATAVSATAQAAEPQAPTQPTDGMTAKVFAVRYVDVRHVASVLEVFGGAARPQTDLRVIAWGGPADRLAAVEATVASLDAAPPPARNLLLTAWLVAVSGAGPSPAGLPAPVRAAIERLGDAHAGLGARLLERPVLRVREDSRNAEIKGRLSGPTPSSGAYTLRVRHVEVLAGGPSAVVRLDGLALEAEVPLQAAPGAPEPAPVSTGSLSTDVDLALGATVVVGATTLSSSGDTLLLVLRAAPAE
jgi:hypothetical protein